MQPRETDNRRSSESRILLVEDEFLIATLLEEDLRSAGWDIVGPFADLARATQAARGERIDLAVMDINLNGEMSYPLADELLARDIPVLFLSGYSLANLPQRFDNTPRLSKPYDPKTLIGKVQQIVSSAGQRR